MPQDMFDLSGKVAVVTGASRGIGRAIAHAFAARGAGVALIGRTPETLLESAGEIEIAGNTVSTHVVDVSNAAQVERSLTEVLDAHGRVDILVNNAGISPVYAPLERTEPADWKKVMAVNLDGVFHCCRTFGTHFLGNDGGSIINISSVGGHRGLPRQAAYSASKGGVEQLTKVLALDWAEKGIRVNTIAFGFMETDLTAGVRDHQGISKMLLDHTPMRRFGRLDEVTGAAVFLASNASSYVTGASIMVDGGWTAA